MIQFAVFIQLFLSRSIHYLESGFSFKLFECMDSNTELACNLKKMKLFSSLNQFLASESSKFSNLILNNFRTIFLGYFLTCGCIFAVFCLNRLVNRLMQMVKNRVRFE